MHRCPHCDYSFPDAESLRRHLEEGRGCPEQDSDTRDLTLLDVARSTGHLMIIGVK